MQSKPVHRSWITVVGWSPMAVVNTIWQACEQGVVPDRILLLASPDEKVRQSVQTVTHYLHEILPRYGVEKPKFDEVPIDENNFMGFWNTLKSVLKKESQIAQGIVIDATAGRKYMSAFAVMQSISSNLPIEHVYYNHMITQRYHDVPYPLIPRPAHQLYDLLRLFRR
ncbi:MAG: hypothetical protein D6697_04095 [Armatimonadetes bacterium]|nr:MAG: hypothetical protein D6697_04095 [Armatimonadota bacterium]